MKPTRVDTVRLKLLTAAVIGGLTCGSGFVGTAWSEKAPKSCTEAHRACAGTAATVPKACDEQKKWCMSTGTFEDPKTKSLHLNLIKK
jgi:hypothetical protein